MARICLVALLLTGGLAGSAAGGVVELSRAAANDPAWPALGRAELERGEIEWRSGRPQEARNRWYRAHCWLDRTGGASVLTRQTMDRLMADVEASLVPVSPSPAPSPSPSRPAPSPNRKAARPTARRPDAAAVIRSAEAAHASGQTEKAVRLMRIAAGLPGGESAAAVADRWELEMSRAGGAGQAER